MSDDTTTADGAEQDGANRIEVVGGGVATAEQLAAVVVALTPVAGPDEDAAVSDVPAWARAGLLENVGGRRVASRADLVTPGSRL